MHGSIHLFDRLPQVNASEKADGCTARSPVRDNPLVGLIRNARSHRNLRGEAASHIPEGVLLRLPEKRSELPGILAEFAERQVDCIAIDGGDGTVRDVLTCGTSVFGDCWPTLMVVPNGKTNALALDLGLPTDWTLADAIAALRAGNVARRHPLVISLRDNPQAQVRGFIMGAGVFNRCIALGQRSHDLGAFNGAAIGVTAVWSVMQALLGSATNPWRKGTHMSVRQGDGREVPHYGGLPANERYLLFASTLKEFPAGLDPFRGREEPLCMAVLDNPRRGLLLRIASLMRGTASEAMLKRGGHVVGDTTMELDIAESFILDGEAFPSGYYQISAGAPLHFVVA
ncbi:diacylglycerol/lipid kinase family protein [Aurantiacibacter sp. D1-12]|uniref:diacylglycerol/lipid kinase family protein n=1 Tax=Aurantiacibacter sp. D1-12 TaxID=2993658 RepID=UPI00237CC295|nr:diacylglycerol kinase family protein [Aurantiacibacter sp. D1-12]MDE1468217.1 diacylglycerol kinase family protein [Aurantiacibacter sp. D1-12]